MPVTCYAKHCGHQRKSNFRMFRFPSEQLRRATWIRNCGRNSAPNSARLCEYHFDDSQFEKHRQDGWRKLKPNAVPTIFNYFSNAQMHTFDAEPQTDKTIHEMNVAEIEQDIPENINHSLNDESCTNDNQTILFHNYCLQSSTLAMEKATQTDEDIILQTRNLSDESGTIRQANEIKRLQRELQITRLENERLKTRLKNANLGKIKKIKSEH